MKISSACIMPDYKLFNRVDSNCTRLSHLDCVRKNAANALSIVASVFPLDRSRYATHPTANTYIGILVSINSAFR